MGSVIVEETSFRTIQDVKIVIPKPIGKMKVNGRDATYTAIRDEIGTRGVTQVVFFTGSKLFVVTAIECITTKDEASSAKLKKCGRIHV